MTPEAATWWALVAAEVTALVLAALVARRWTAAGESLNQWATVAVIAYALADELAVEAIRLHLAPVPRPFAGLSLALYQASNALVLGWPCVLAAASWRVFGWPHRARLAAQVIAAGWFGAWLVLVLGYPVGRLGTARVLQLVEIVVAVAAVVPIVGAWRRPWGRAHVGIGLLVAVEAAVATIGPWLRDVFRDWRLATVAYLVGFTALAVLCGVWLRRDRHSKP